MIPPLIIRGKRGSNIMFPGILWLLGRISSGQGDGNFGNENQDLKKWGWAEYQVGWNSIRPCLQVRRRQRGGQGEDRGGEPAPIR